MIEIFVIVSGDSERSALPAPQWSFAWIVYMDRVKGGKNVCAYEN
jgi:hypothetical protein